MKPPSGIFANTHKVSAKFSTPPEARLTSSSQNNLRHFSSESGSGRSTHFATNHGGNGYDIRQLVSGDFKNILVENTEICQLPW